MYTLPNNAVIDADGVRKGINETDSSKESYLDIVTGQVATVETGKQKFDKKRYFKIPKVSNSKRMEWARNYVKDLMNPEDKLSVSLLKALDSKTGGFDKFFKIFEKTNEIYGWGQWEHDYLCDEMLDWFDTLPVEIKDEWDLDDDCPLCQLMKSGEHSVEDFKKVAKKMPKFNLPEQKIKNKNDLYYDAMEILDGTKTGARKALKLLNEALKLDADCAQTQIGFISAYGELGDEEKRIEHTKKAFKLARKKFPKWPKEMRWGFLENRQYLRAIQFMAEDLADFGDKNGAIKLYKVLLKINPGDNQGIRYLLSGLYAGISGQEINDMFDDGNQKQDWSKLEKLVEIQNKKYKFWKPPKLD